MTISADISAGELKQLLLSPRWRLQNLYTIVDDAAREIPFSPNDEQQQLTRELHYRNLTLKARQLGFTTQAGVIALDQAIFNPNFQAGVIAHSLPDSMKIFRNKVRKVYDLLPAMVQQLAPIKSASASEIVFENGSSVSVGTSHRGGTLQFLHVSEMGKIARRFPEKATEIVTGAFEAVPRDGIIQVESTAEGRAGWFFEAVMEAMRRQATGRPPSQLEFKLHFFPWWTKASYRMSAASIPIPDNLRRYFAELAAKGIKLDDQQKAWYAAKYSTLGEHILREYPSFEEEAFKASVAGMILAAEMKLMRQTLRLGRVPLVPGVPVNTFWDFGVNDHNAIWLHQRVGAMNRMVYFTQDQNQGLEHYWTLLEGWRVENDARWGRHFLPHDADTRMQGAKVFTRREVLTELGMNPDKITVVPRITSLNDGIELMKRAMVGVEIDEEGCAEGVDCLDNYSRKWDDNAQDWGEPRHDAFSHGADAFRQFAQAMAQGPVEEAGGRFLMGGAVEAIDYGRGGY